VRDYILHDRGNSLFLGKSFGNLPSPVNESATIKRLFKFNEDEKEAKPKNDIENQQIRIEGKEKMSPERKEPQRDFKVDLKDLNKIVFEQTNNKVTLDSAYAHTKQPKLNQSYQEEESYENPQNVSRVAHC